MNIESEVSFPVLDFNTLEAVYFFIFYFLFFPNLTPKFFSIVGPFPAVSGFVPSSFGLSLLGSQIVTESYLRPS